VSGNTHVVSFVADLKLYIESLKSVAYVLERWRMKVRYLELKKPVGKKKYILGEL
jgi:hypothetical protein